MGLTIHYDLVLTDGTPKKVRQVVESLRKKALGLPFKEVGEVVEISGWEADYNHADRDNPHWWLLIQANQFIKRGEFFFGAMPKQIIAFSTWPGEGSEQANFGLAIYPDSVEVEDKNHRLKKVRTELEGWSWQSFCKTQYASNPEVGGIENFLRCHLAVIGVLDHARDLGIVKEVSDQGDFWEKRDLQALAAKVVGWNRLVAGWTGQFKDKFGGVVSAEITKFPTFEHLEAEGRGSK